MKFLVCKIFIFSLLYCLSSYAQISINTTGANPDGSAALDIQFTNKGLLIPRMTTAQRDAISSPANSLLIFNTTTNCFEWRDVANGIWVQMSCPCTSPSAPVAYSASNLSTSSFTANWNSVSGATGYRLDVSLNSSFTSMVPGYTDLNVGNIIYYNVTGLGCNTTYYFRVRAYNNCGASVSSNIISVTTLACPSGACGSQIFMTTNMDVGMMIMNTNEQNNDAVIEKYCYNNNAANCASYGALYQWAEAIQAPYSANLYSYTGSWATCDPCGSSGRQGICPSGYHVPTDYEFSRYQWCVETTISPTGTYPLIDFQTYYGWRGTNGPAGPGYKMKATSSDNPSFDGSNVSGFNVVPAGYRMTNGSFWDLGLRGYYWVATEYSDTQAWFQYFEIFQNVVMRTNLYQKYYGYSLRCLKD